MLNMVEVWKIIHLAQNYQFGLRQKKKLCWNRTTLRTSFFLFRNWSVFKQDLISHSEENKNRNTVTHKKVKLENVGLIWDLQSSGFWIDHVLQVQTEKELWDMNFTVQQNNIF